MIDISKYKHVVKLLSKSTESENIKEFVTVDIHNDGVDECFKLECTGSRVNKIVKAYVEGVEGGKFADIEGNATKSIVTTKPINGMFRNKIIGLISFILEALPYNHNQEAFRKVVDKYGIIDIDEATKSRFNAAKETFENKVNDALKIDEVTAKVDIFSNSLFIKIDETMGVDFGLDTSIDMIIPILEKFNITILSPPERLTTPGLYICHINNVYK